MTSLGYAWLVRHFGLCEQSLSITSRLGTRLRSTHRSDGSTLNDYPPLYAPEETPIGHLEFALKYDSVNLGLLRAIFKKCGQAPIENFIRIYPTSKYARLLGFYYEWTTGSAVDTSIRVGGNYFPVLSPKDYLTSPEPKRNRRWRVLDNLLGDARFCPMVRMTPAVMEGMNAKLQAELQKIVTDFPSELFARAADYLYLKETHSTYGIEREAMPPADRTRRFVHLLRSAGEGTLPHVLAESELVKRQIEIVDPRFSVSQFRSHQNYVGEQRPDYSERIHYICPPPQFVPTLMAGLIASAERTMGLHAVVRAAVISFGFVFIHPFEDGNGRLHRFLIHDVLHRERFVAPGVMLPVSATMLRQLREYDEALERYSRPLMDELIVYELDREGNAVVSNPDDVEGYYRFPDLTPQVDYLLSTVATSIREDFAEELQFLQRHDRARKSIRDIVDLPDRRLNLLLQILHQNQGRLSKVKRDQFEEVTDAELTEIEKAFKAAF